MLIGRRLMATASGATGENVDAVSDDVAGCAIGVTPNSQDVVPGAEVSSTSDERIHAVANRRTGDGHSRRRGLLRRRRPVRRLPPKRHRTRDGRFRVEEYLEIKTIAQQNS
jgi:hypothetical protein